MVDAAVALKNRGHEVAMFTSRHDKSRCFEETRDGERKVLADVLTADSLDRNFAGQCTWLVYTSVTTSKVPNDYRLFDTALHLTRPLALLLIHPSWSGITDEPLTWIGAL